MNLLQNFILLTSMMTGIQDAASSMYLYSKRVDNEEDSVCDVTKVIESVVARRVLLQQDRQMFDQYFMLAGICKFRSIMPSQYYPFSRN